MYQLNYRQNSGYNHCDANQYCCCCCEYHIKEWYNIIVNSDIVTIVQKMYI